MILNISKYKHNRYLDLVIAIIVAYIGIKIVNNYTFFFSIVNKFFSIISPFIFAVIIAYILNPIMKFFEKRFKLKRGLSIMCTYILLIGLLSIIIIYLIPKISSNILDIAKNIPYFANETQIWFQNLLKSEGIKSIMDSTGGFNFDLNFITTKLSGISMSILNAFVDKTVSFTSQFIKWIFGFLVSIYILNDKEKFISITKKSVYMILKEKNADKVIRFSKNIHYMIGMYIGIKAIDSLIIGVMAFIGLAIIKSPYSLLIALVVGITNMIPYFGPFIGMLVAFMINIFFSPVKAFIALIFLFLLQQFDAWYLDPKLIGGKVGLSPFLVIFAVTLGGGIYGPIGMVLAVPIVAVIKIYADRLFEKYNTQEEES